MCLPTLWPRTALMAACLVAAGCVAAPVPRPRTEPLPPGAAARPDSVPALTAEAPCRPVPEAFLEALAEARTPTSEKVSRDLLAIVGDDERLRWNDRGQVLMVTWAKASHFPYEPGETFALYRDTFLTAYPEVRDWCREYAGRDPGGLSYRLHQLLGLQPPEPGAEDRVFVEVWVDPEDFFRPCPDPGIFDHECLVRVPLVGQPRTKVRGETKDRPPWFCPRPSAPQQVAGAFVQVNVHHLEWMCSYWETAYGDDCPANNYPWTALGYSFDWGNPEDPVGPSEFVCPSETEVEFHSMTKTDEYCGVD